MSDAYADYCEERQTFERMKITLNGLKRWNSTDDVAKLEKLAKLRSDFTAYENRLRCDLSQLNIGHAKEELTNLRCFVLNALEELGIV